MWSGSKFAETYVAKSQRGLLIILSLLAASASAAEEVVRDQKTDSGVVEREPTQSEKGPAENRDEEFKIRYKKPKQRHDDDAAPVPKFNQKPSLDEATDAPGTKPK